MTTKKVFVNPNSIIIIGGLTYTAAETKVGLDTTKGSLYFRWEPSGSNNKVILGNSATEAEFETIDANGNIIS